MKPRILLVAWVAAGMLLTATSPTAGEPNPLTCGLSTRDARITLSVVGSVRDEVKLPVGIQPAAQGIRVCKKLAAEAVAYDPFSRRLFVPNQADLSLDIYAIKDIFRNPRSALPRKKIYTQRLFRPGETALWTPDHVDVWRGMVAFAMSSNTVTDPGRVALLDSDGNLLRKYVVGSRPDMLAYTPDGRYIVVANEGRPDETYSDDPEGSVTIIDPWREPHRDSAVRTASFGRFNHLKEQLVAEGSAFSGHVLARPGSDATPMARQRWLKTSSLPF
jgi:Choice-of-anchor I domain